MRMWEETAQSRTDQGPAMYYGYCNRSRRYRMMNLSDYMGSIQQGVNRWVNDAHATYQSYARTYSNPAGVASRPGCRGECDCHCDCCICDSDVVVHARCGESRRIPITFENDTRRDREVTLELSKFTTAGGRDLQWPATLSETKFTLRPCGEHTVIVSVDVRCDQVPGDVANQQAGAVDRCEVGYGSLRADGCTVRPVMMAVAVLPNDCDAYRCPCGGCCCN
jgi:hypothetical protein